MQQILNLLLRDFPYARFQIHMIIKLHLNQNNSSDTFNPPKILESQRLADVFKRSRKTPDA